MDERLTRLLAIVEIKYLAACFAEAATLGDQAAFRALWDEGGEWTIGQPPGVSARGVDEIVQTLARLRQGKAFFVQFAHPGSITFDQDRARMTCLHHEEARGPGESFYRNHAISRDKLVLKNGEWVFESRRFYYVWLDKGAFGGESFQDFAQHPF